MGSWWELGEGSGYRGTELSASEITCPFCMEKGNFKTAFHSEKRKSNSSKKLNFDTLECGNCRGYVMVLWSASEHGGLYSFKVLPWPIKFEQYPAHWPEAVGRFWLQAHRGMKEENWDAVVLMARSSLQAALRHSGAKGKSLKEEIHDLALKSILPPILKEWSEQVREIGNESAHPSLAAIGANPRDARDIVNFLDFLLEYLFDLPHRIDLYRKRAAEEKR